MTVLVSLDTEEGIIRRYTGTGPATHAAGLIHDPEDAEKTKGIIERFRHSPSGDHVVKVARPRTIDDALREQRQKRAEAEQRGQA